jgi:starch synthase
MKVAVAHSDAVIVGSENLDAGLTKIIESSGKPFLPFTPKEAFAQAYTAFYKEML